MTPARPSEPIRIAAAVIVDEQGRHLLVRKRGTTVFMQAGGKIEPGEEPSAALVRELAEELGLQVAVSAADHIGRAEAPAANEAGRTVVAELFRVAAPRNLSPAAEIEEIAWVAPADTGSIPIAPLTREHVLTLRLT